MPEMTDEHGVWVLALGGENDDPRDATLELREVYDAAQSGNEADLAAAVVRVARALPPLNETEERSLKATLDEGAEDHLDRRVIDLFMTPRGRRARKLAISVQIISSDGNTYEMLGVQLLQEGAA